MSDTCNKCGGYTECIIGNYYQCPKCKSSPGTASLSSEDQGTIIYYGSIPPQSMPPEMSWSYWTQPLSHSPNAYKVIGKHTVAKSTGFSNDVAVKIIAEEKVTFVKVSV